MVKLVLNIPSLSSSSSSEKPFFHFHCNLTPGFHVTARANGRRRTGALWQAGPAQVAPGAFQTPHRLSLQIFQIMFFFIFLTPF